MSGNTEHEHAPLIRAGLTADPLDQFAKWFEEATRLIEMPEAVNLATADQDGRPDARMVLMKGFGADGFRFFTNHESSKGGQLTRNPWAAMVFFWRELDRQVRIRGPVERLSEQESDDYHASRDRGSRLGAWASPQSRVIKNRQELDRRLEEADNRFAVPAGEIPRPPHWGGFLLHHHEVEFWQGRLDRLHDRFLYTRGAGAWTIERLAP